MSMQSETPSFWRPGRPLLWFFLAAVLLFILRFVLALTALPPGIAMGASILSTATFIIVPFVGLFCGASFEWKSPQAWLLFGTGVLLHGASMAVLQNVKLAPIFSLTLGNFMQIGMMFWTLGLGVLVSILIREKIMLLPIAIFLAGMDALLILTPFTPQAKIAAQNPEIVGNLGLKVPAVNVSQPGMDNLPIAVNDILVVGPADLFISAMFFAAMFRYRMRPRQTAIWLIPVLIAYLFLVLLTQIPLPALVPIGLTALLVNWKEFNLSKDERVATWLVTVIALAMTGYGTYARATYKPSPKPPAESLPQDGDQGLVKPEGSTPQLPPNPNR